jgi:hypothetical protein
MNKIVAVFGMLLIFSGVFLFFYNNQPQKTDCDGMGVIYLRPSEIEHTQKLLKDNPNAIVSIPEINRIIGNVETLECENFKIPEGIVQLP